MTPKNPQSAEAQRLRTVSWIVALATLGLIFDGYDLVVYGAVVSTFLREASHIGNVTPATAGPLLAGDIVGRRKVMLMYCAWFSVGMACTAIAATSTALCWLRFATELGIGSLLVTTAALVSECALAGKKNLVNAITNGGIPLSSLLAALLAILLVHNIGWRGLVWMGTLPIITLLSLARTQNAQRPVHTAPFPAQAVVLRRTA